MAEGFGERPRPRRLLAADPAEESAEVAGVRLPPRDAGRPRWGESSARSWCCTSASVGGVAQLRAASTRRAMVTQSATGDASAGCSDRVKVTFLAFFFLGCGGSPPRAAIFAASVARSRRMSARPEAVDLLRPPPLKGSAALSSSDSLSDVRSAQRGLGSVAAAGLAAFVIEAAAAAAILALRSPIRRLTVRSHELAPPTKGSKGAQASVWSALTIIGAVSSFRFLRTSRVSVVAPDPQKERPECQ